jgi:hypothetical protein
MGRLPDDSVEPLGAERGIIAEVEVDVTLKRAIGVERGPAVQAIRATGYGPAGNLRRSQAPGLGVPTHPNPRLPEILNGSTRHVTL